MLFAVCADGGQAAASTAGKAGREAVRRSGMQEAEARMVLNVKPKATDAEILEVRPSTRARDSRSASGLARRRLFFG